MKKPFIHAVTAVLYIVSVVLVIHTGGEFLKKETLILPIGMIGLLVLSVSVMGFLFLSEPFRLFMEDRKQEAVTFFAKTVGIFACFVIALGVLSLLI